MIVVQIHTGSPMKIEIVPETSVELPTGDFLNDDVDELMNTPIVAPTRSVDINAQLTAYDKELMSFKPRAKRRTWPQPIR